jgi:hypothetical protein
MKGLVASYNPTLSALIRSSGAPPSFRLAVPVCPDPPRCRSLRQSRQHPIPPGPFRTQPAARAASTATGFQSTQSGAAGSISKIKEKSSAGQPGSLLPSPASALRGHNPGARPRLYHLIKTEDAALFGRRAMSRPSNLGRALLNRSCSSLWFRKSHPARFVR